MAGPINVPILFSSSNGISEETEKRSWEMCQRDLVDWKIDERIAQAVAKERGRIRLIVCKAVIDNPDPKAQRALRKVIDGINDLAGIETQDTKRRRRKRTVSIR